MSYDYPYRPRVRRRPETTVVITARQAQCLDALADGLTAGETAQLLGIDVQTVRTHQKRLYAALGARSAAHALGLVLTSRVTVLVRDPAQVRKAAA